MENCLDREVFERIGVWHTLREIASHKGTGKPFPHPLMNVCGCDFDAVKDYVCKSRLGALHSVDMVMPGHGGKLYFIEFKDSKDNQIAELRRKAFDSLAVFWLSFGKDLTMDQIAAMSEFVLVKPDAERQPPASTSIFQDLLAKDATSMSVPTGAGSEPLELQLPELGNCGLYSNERVVYASEFENFWNGHIGFCDTATFLHRISQRTGCVAGASATNTYRSATLGKKRTTLSGILLAARTCLGLHGCSHFPASQVVCEFHEAVNDLLQKREYQPNIIRQHQEKQLYVAIAVHPESNTLYGYSNLDIGKRPLASLVNTAFDSFFLWAWTAYGNQTLCGNLSQFTMTVYYEGALGVVKKDGKPMWIRYFLDNYLPWLNACHFDSSGRRLSFGLAYFRDEVRFYKDLSTLPIQ